MADLLSQIKGGKSLEMGCFSVQPAAGARARRARLGGMRWAPAGLAAAVALALGAPAASGAPGCAPAGARILARDAAVRVYETVPKNGRAIAACLVGHSGRMTLLAAQPHPGLHRTLSRFELAGHIVAYVETQFGVDSGTSTLVVADVGTRHILRSLEAGSYADAGILDRRSVTRFVITTRGSIAWISEQTQHEQLVEVAVHAAPSRGPVVLLDSGRDIDPSSLRLSGSTLSWSRAGSQRSARMP
jgi:hypothetical protein